MTRNLTAVAKLAGRIKLQREWIADHGGSEAGYVTTYGSASDPDCYGDGGEAIYAADRAELNALLSEQELCVGFLLVRQP